MSIAHPLSFLKQEWIDIIHAYAIKAENNGALCKGQLEIFYKEQWFKILAPIAYGGLEWNLTDVLRLEEGISCVDGSAGWVLTLCAGAGWFGGFMDVDFAKEIFSNPHVCLAGSGAPTGTAELADTGYIVNGRWYYASGAPDATIFTANCIITKDGITQYDNESKPIVLSFAFLKDEVTIVPTWQSVGMVATASNAYEVQNLCVPANRTFRISPDNTVINTLLYKYPFLQLAETTLAVNISGMAIHFLDLCGDIFATKKSRNGILLIDEQQVNKAFINAQQQMAAARIAFYDAVAISWQECAEGKISNASIKQVSISARHLATIARQSVGNLYPFCGLAAADKHTDINRVWRDLHTASQHSLLAFEQ